MNWHGEEEEEEDLGEKKRQNLGEERFFFISHFVIVSVQRRGDFILHTHSCLLCLTWHSHTPTTLFTRYVFLAKTRLLILRFPLFSFLCRHCDVRQWHSRDICPPPTSTSLALDKCQRKPSTQHVIILPSGQFRRQSTPAHQDLNHCSIVFLNHSAIQNLRWNQLSGIQLQSRRKSGKHR